MTSSLLSVAVLSLASLCSGSIVPTPYVDLTRIIRMPSLNLGTCCGSSPDVGLAPWLAAQGLPGAGIDTVSDNATLHMPVPVS